MADTIPPVILVDLSLQTPTVSGGRSRQGRLVYLPSPFLESIQADCWVREIIRHGYSIDLIRRGPEHTNPLEGPLMRSNEVEDLLQEGTLVLRVLQCLCPRTQYIRWRPQTHLNLKFFNLTVCKTSFKMETAPS